MSASRGAEFVEGGKGVYSLLLPSTLGRRRLKRCLPFCRGARDVWHVLKLRCRAFYFSISSSTFSLASVQMLNALLSC
jgi:hypothetical protein